jgi:hypothetical protein
MHHEGRNAIASRGRGWARLSREALGGPNDGLVEELHLVDAHDRGAGTSRTSSVASLTGIASAAGGDYGEERVRGKERVA